MDKGQLALIVTDAINGDTKAKNDLFNEYIGAVYAFATEHVNDKNTACDVTQDTFIEVMNNLGDLDSADVFDSWIASVVCAQCTKYMSDGDIPAYDGETDFFSYTGDIIPIEVAETIAICVSLETGTDISVASAATVDAIIHGVEADDPFEDMLRDFMGIYDEDVEEEDDESDIAVLGAVGKTVLNETPRAEKITASGKDENVIIHTAPKKSVINKQPPVPKTDKEDKVSPSPVMTKLVVCSITAVVALGGVVAAFTGAGGEDSGADKSSVSYTETVTGDRYTDITNDTEDVGVIIPGTTENFVTETGIDESETTITGETEVSSESETEPEVTPAPVVTTEPEVTTTVTSATEVIITETETTSETETDPVTETITESETTVESESDTTTEEEPEPPVENSNDFAGNTRFSGLSGTVQSSSGGYVRYELELLFMPMGGDIYDVAGNPVTVDVPVMMYGEYSEHLMLSETEVSDEILSIIKSIHSDILPDATVSELFSNETYFATLNGEEKDGVKYIMYKAPVSGGDFGYCNYVVYDGGSVELIINEGYKTGCGIPVNSITVSGDKTRVNVTLAGAADGVSVTMYVS